MRRILAGSAVSFSRRGALIGALALAACGKKGEAEPAPTKAARNMTLQDAVAGDWRSPADKARDAWRHPIETLEFWGLQPGQTVVEFWPGSGWYTEILAPYLAKGAGTYVAALFPEGPTADPAQAVLNTAFRTRFSSDRKLYGEPQFSVFGAASGPVIAMMPPHAWATTS